ncbi:hypothetical protein PHSY_000029 [Pseudozyma hubeiensis SY62]|uniref:Uncharacterized protein n=1 Tax=Pseudozyma hubeiensis (strain SY62) TaxID=1305764 RepID=R9NVN3_PSEHS|nr:hypothetical protein PHSY_000029 [Pseudozyma hubeiensis SY62]GAC92476.1 hypothetical protein PHSY_000029 [Pseudozyma hubeiensis SY62]
MASAVAVAMPVPPTAGIKARPMLSIDPAVLAKPSTPAFVVPTILITPPDAPPQYSTSVPEQKYEKSVLFVPVKTEELGWDEHGLYWNGTYAYPVHQIYNKEGQPIGRRRKGPHGYRFEEYYDNKKPRRGSSPHSSASSSSSSPSSAAADDTVEEASVRLEEPAPQRIEFTAKSIVPEEQAEGPVPEPMEEEAEELVSPTSPTLSVASDWAETEDSSSICDDSSSLWSRNDAASDDGESRCTSPGVMSPPMDVDTPAELQVETLSKKLSDLPAANKVNKTSWLSLGTLPSSTASPSSASSSSAASSRSQSLPVSRVTRSKPALEISRNHRATSSPILDPPQREHRRHSTPMAFQSIIQDLTTSPFASSSSTLSAKAPYRSATLPRSTSRTVYTQSKLAGSVLRPPPPQYTSAPRNTHDDPSSSSSSSSSSSKFSSRSRSEAWHSTPDSDFAAGWAFENPSSAPMANHY